MDASMYEMSGGVSSTLIEDRRHHMTLDFAASAQRKCFYPSATSSSHNIDCSKVTSPDLEAFLLYASAGSGGEVDWADSASSGTPTQILFPKSVTAEQEAYARGFVDALEELHRRQGVPAQSVIWTQSSPSCSSSSCRTSDVSYQLQTSSTVPGCPSSSVSSPGSSVGGPSDASRVVDADRPRHRRTTTDDGVQTVPRLSCLTPPSSPDVDPTDLARIDRKRERNRLAAQKCRNRKLEQIAVLESGCAVLRAENDALARTAKQLAEDVAQLRQTLAEHTTGPHCVMNNTYTSSSSSPSL